MTVVLDASAAARIVLNADPGRRLAKLVGEADAVFAPQLFVAEVGNTYWKYFRAGQLTRAEAQAALRDSLALVEEIMPLEPLATEALELAMLAERPVYDMFYLVLARRHAAILATADEGLVGLARKVGVRTRVEG